MMQEGNHHPEYHSLEEIKDVIRRCLRQLYQKDHILFQRNKGKGLCERCIVFRLGFYLQETLSDFFVDCDFNSASVGGREVHGKSIENPDGRTTTNRYVDIIIHGRTGNPGDDFICFEIKKWNNYSKKAIAKDINNLEVLTQQYRYKYGFNLNLGKSLEKTKWTIFQNGRILENERPVIQNSNNRTND